MQSAMRPRSRDNWSEVLRENVGIQFLSLRQFLWNTVSKQRHYLSMQPTRLNLRFGDGFCPGSRHFFTRQLVS